MPLQYQQLKIEDFSGGITDKYVGALPSESKELTNYYINELGKPEMMGGYRVVYDQEALKRIMGIFKVKEDLIVFRFEQAYLFDKDAKTLTQVQTYNPGSLFKYTGDDSYPSAIDWRGQLIVTSVGRRSPVSYNRPVIIHRDKLGALRSFSAGLPFIQANMSASVSVDAGVAQNYIYAYHYSYEYTVSDNTFRAVGPVSFTERVGKSVVINPTSGIDVSNLQALAISDIDQMDISNVKLEIYRTVANGTSYIKLPSNGVAGELQGEYNVNALTAGIKIDLTDDDTLSGGEVLYSQSSTELFPAPKSKYLTIANDAIYYMNCVEEIQDTDTRIVSELVKPYRVYQSFPGNPNMINPFAFVDLEDDIMGGGSLSGIAIVMTKSRVYRIEGQIDGANNGIMRTKVISDTAGCLSHRSIVVANDRIFWAGTNGFYVSDGFNVELATPRLLDSYGVISETEERGERITATYDDRNQRIIWATSDNDIENNEWWILNIRSGSGFTKANGELLRSSAIYSDDNIIYRGDELGYIYAHENKELSHYRRNSSIPSSLWSRIHIPYRIETAAQDMGNRSVKKWGREVTVSLKSPTNMAILPISNNDDTESIKRMHEIRIAGTWLWRDPNVLWLNPEISWRNTETSTKQRHFPRGHSRFRTKSVILEPSKTVLHNSDFWGVADLSYVDPLDPRDMNLAITGTNKWPINVNVDSVVFEEEGYATEHSIISRTDQNLIISGGSISVGLNKKWHIVGYIKEIKHEIKDITITFAGMDNIGDRFDKSDTGGNDGA